MASSDAQNVDYGIDVEPRANFIGDSIGADNSNAGWCEHNTPESNVSIFGVVNYPFDALPKKREKGIPVAGRLKKGGVGETAGFTRGVNSGGNLVGSASRPLDAVQEIVGSSPEMQNEAAINRRYFGQLGEYRGVG